MKAETLSNKIEGLVEHLRGADEGQLQLVDIASVTEVLINSMRLYFRQIDTQIYKEFRSLYDYIETAKGDIAKLRPDEMKNERLPRAGLELDAIVDSTEKATNEIMEAAEAMMELDPSDPDAFQAAVMDHCMKIFEACSFQDITGQRISKVVTTLSFIEERLSMLQESWWDEFAEEGDAAEKPQGDEALLNGPQLSGEGIDQSFVDSVDFDSAPTSAAGEGAGEDTGEVTGENTGDDAAADTAEPVNIQEPVMDAVPSANAEPEEAPAAEEPAPATDAAEDKKKKDDGSSQADIDAMFD